MNQIPVTPLTESERQELDHIIQAQEQAIDTALPLTSWAELGDIAQQANLSIAQTSSHLALLELKDKVEFRRRWDNGLQLEYRRI